MVNFIRKCISMLILSSLLMGCSRDITLTSEPSKLKANTFSTIENSDIALKELSKDSELICKLPEGREFYCIACDENNIYMEAKDNSDSLDVSYYRYSVVTNELIELYSPQNWNYLLNPIAVDDSLVVPIITGDSVDNGLKYQIVDVSNEQIIKPLIEDESFYYPEIVKVDKGFVVEDFKAFEDGIICRLTYYSFENSTSTTVYESTYNEDEDGQITGEKITYVGNIGNELVICISNDIGTMFYYLDIDSREVIPCEFQPGYECNYYWGDNTTWVTNRRYKGSLYSSWSYLFFKDGETYKKIDIPAEDTHIRSVMSIGVDKVYVGFYLGCVVIDTSEMTFAKINDTVTTCNGNEVYFVENNNLYRAKALSNDSH